MNVVRRDGESKGLQDLRTGTLMRRTRWGFIRTIRLRSTCSRIRGTRYSIRHQRVRKQGFSFFWRYPRLVKKG